MAIKPGQLHPECGLVPHMVFIVIALCTLTVVYIKSDYTDINATAKYRSPDISFVKALTGDVSTIMVQPESVNFKMHIRINAGIIVSSYVLLFIYEVLAILMIYNLRRVFASISKRQPFEYHNIRRLKITAVCVALFMPLNLLIDVLNYFLLSKNVPNFHQTFRISDTGNVMLIVLGVIIYILADVFSYGFELKKENEEFV